MKAPNKDLLNVQGRTVDNPSDKPQENLKVQPRARPVDDLSQELGGEGLAITYDNMVIRSAAVDFCRCTNPHQQVSSGFACSSNFRGLPYRAS